MPSSRVVHLSGPGGVTICNSIALGHPALVGVLSSRVVHLSDPGGVTICNSTALGHPALVGVLSSRVVHHASVAIPISAC